MMCTKRTFQPHSSAKEYDGACYETFGEEASVWCCSQAFQRLDLMATYCHDMIFVHHHI